MPVFSPRLNAVLNKIGTETKNWQKPLCRDFHNSRNRRRFGNWIAIVAQIRNMLPHSLAYIFLYVLKRIAHTSTAGQVGNICSPDVISFFVYNGVFFHLLRLLASRHIKCLARGLRPSVLTDAGINNEFSVRQDGWRNAFSEFICLAYASPTSLLTTGTACKCAQAASSSGLFQSTASDASLKR